MLVSPAQACMQLMKLVPARAKTGCYLPEVQPAALFLCTQSSAGKQRQQDWDRTLHLRDNCNTCCRVLLQSVVLTGLYVDTGRAWICASNTVDQHVELIISHDTYVPWAHRRVHRCALYTSRVVTSGAMPLRCKLQCATRCHRRLQYLGKLSTSITSVASVQTVEIAACSPCMVVRVRATAITL
jgi:hypothetical protein